MQNPELTRALTDSAIPAPKFKSALGTYVRLIRQSRDDSSIEARQAAECDRANRRGRRRRKNGPAILAKPIAS
jgi:hypothetical protein